NKKLPEKLNNSEDETFYYMNIIIPDLKSNTADDIKKITGKFIFKSDYLFSSPFLAKIHTLTQLDQSLELLYNKNRKNDNLIQESVLDKDSSIFEVEKGLCKSFNSNDLKILLYFFELFKFYNYRNFELKTILLFTEDSNLLIEYLDQLIANCNKLCSSNIEMDHFPDWRDFLIDCMSMKANEYVKIGKYKDAKKVSDELLKEYTNISILTTIEIIKIHIKIRNFSEAESMCHELLTSNPENKTIKAILSKLIIEKNRCKLFNEKVYEEICSEIDSTTDRPSQTPQQNIISVKFMIFLAIAILLVA
ncbi:MAG: hypothetical protein MHPSP_002331, partial [Paramarteilia canceri]